MNDREKADVTAGFEGLFKELAGDPITWVDAEGTETDLTCLWADVANKDDNEGLIVTSGGTAVGGMGEATFFEPMLTEKGVTFDGTGYAIRFGERWDLAEGQPVLRHQMPLAGLHLVVTVRLRKAVELNKTIPGSEFTYGD